jgi:GT2 family glycosyltransferase
LLRDCLVSLLDHPQGVALEVIVADNASDDQAADMVAREFPQVILLRNASNEGYARANNQAASRACGRYLFFLNNDTVVPPNTLGRLLRYAEEHRDVGMIGPRLRDGAGQVQVSYRPRPTPAALLHRTSLFRWTRLWRTDYLRYRRDFDPETVRSVEVLMGAALFLPQQVFFACGAWDEEYAFGGEDLDLSLRVGRRHRLVYLPEVEITHYGRASTRQHIGFAFSQIAIGFARYLSKSGCSKWALAAYKLVISLDAPIQVVEKGLQYSWRRACGRKEDAAKSLVALRGYAHFLLRGLWSFWRV